MVIKKSKVFLILFLQNGLLTVRVLKYIGSIGFTVNILNLDFGNLLRFAVSLDIFSKFVGFIYNSKLILLKFLHANNLKILKFTHLYGDIAENKRFVCKIMIGGRIIGLNFFHLQNYLPRYKDILTIDELHLVVLSLYSYILYYYGIDFFFQTFSIYGLSLKIFITKFLKIRKFFNVHAFYQNIFRKYFVGGRVLVKKPYYKSPTPFSAIYMYDVNSMYNYVWENDFIPINIKSVVIINKMHNYVNLGDFSGFVSVDVVKIPLQKIPFLPIFWMNGRYSYCSLRVDSTIEKQFYSIEMVLYAISIGYCFFIKSIFVSETITSVNLGLQDFLQEFYVKKSCSTTKVERSFWKAILVGLYGRLFLKTQTRQFKFLSLDDYSNLKLQYLNYSIQRVDLINSRYFVHLVKNNFYKNLEKKNKIKTNVIFSYFTSTQSLVYCHRILVKYQNFILYHDCDNFVLTVQIKENIGPNIGQLKLELSLIGEVFVLRKKLLEIHDLHGVRVVKKTSGLPKDSLPFLIKDLFSYRFLTKEEFLKLDRKPKFFGDCFLDTEALIYPTDFY